MFALIVDVVPADWRDQETTECAGFRQSMPMTALTILQWLTQTLLKSFRYPLKLTIIQVRAGQHASGLVQHPLDLALRDL